MKHVPYVFNHACGELTVFAASPKKAIKKAKQIAGDYRIVPAFATGEQHAR